MLKVELINHDNYYGLVDVVRLFYGPCVENREEGYITCEYAPDLIIQSIAKENSDLPSNRQVKRDLFATLTTLTNTSFPWGCLTGIRPTIVAREEGYDYKSLMEKYFVREDKAKLACDTGKLEYDIARQASSKLNIYTGVPFCPGRCEYCSFVAEDSTKHLDRLSDYADAIIKEMKLLSPAIKEAPGTVYMGGGTPTVFDDKDFARVMEAMADALSIDKETEFTVEAGRPDTITESKLDSMRAAGVNRICINPQTMRDETLMKLNRRHSSEDVIRVFKLARSMGFDVINMDLIAGLKYETADDFLDTINKVIALNPENITIHTLYKKRRAKMTRDDVMVADSRGDIDGAVKTVYEMLYDNGYIPYYMYRQKDTELGLENTGFCKEGTHNIYNVAMMSEECSVLSVGAGGMSKRAFGDGRYERCSCIKDVSLYMNKVEEMAKKKIEFFS
ncbi:MAG: coproporphyrinogen dehydrogenase HemZ [Saccharofermentans sp.]|nr:coproporphyrinogen dehydrogenase HemZ [Saccharofermentans sp.]